MRVLSGSACNEHAKKNVRSVSKHFSVNTDSLSCLWSRHVILPGEKGFSNDVISLTVLHQKSG